MVWLFDMSLPHTGAGSWDHLGLPGIRVGRLGRVSMLSAALSTPSGGALAACTSGITDYDRINSTSRLLQAAC